jgi:hypothetical protein
MKTGSFIVIVVLLFASVNSGAKSNAAFRNKECAFRYPPDLKISVREHGKVIQLVAPNHSAYWENTITIRKHDRKTEECEPPDGTSPDEHDRRKIAGLRAFSYSGDDAAMNRVVKIKGYVIETNTACWRFELKRNGRPFHKFDMPAKELKRLENLSNQDFELATAAFQTVLNSFTVLSSAK